MQRSRLCHYYNQMVGNATEIYAVFRSALRSLLNDKRWPNYEEAKELARAGRRLGVAFLTFLGLSRLAATRLLSGMVTKRIW